MAVTIKSEHEIELMREAGRILAIVHDELAENVKRLSEVMIVYHHSSIIRDFLHQYVHQ